MRTGYGANTKVLSGKCIYRGNIHPRGPGKFKNRALAGLALIVVVVLVLGVPTLALVLA